MKRNIVIGKNTLESLTFGMYLDAKIIYREYIQNSIDSLDEAINRGIISQNKAAIDIQIDVENRKIEIKDNGTGISSKDAANLLLDIGNSNKDLNKNMGFRGIGRLAGISFCEELEFCTSFLGENRRTRVKLDSMKLKEFLVPSSYMDMNLVEVLNAITEIKEESEKGDAHYFKVTLKKVDNVDSILDFNIVCDFISQVAPVPYSSEFVWGQEIVEKAKLMGYNLDQYNIYVSDKHQTKKICKPYKSSFISSPRIQQEDIIQSINMQYVTDERGENIAILWYANTNFYGSVCDNLVKGIRLRKRNVLIGDSTTLNFIFNEERFNGWFLGEVFVLDNKIIPNARRDNFEKNKAYSDMLTSLKNIGAELSTNLRRISHKRNNDFISDNLIEDLQKSLRSKDTQEKEAAYKAIKESKEKIKNGRNGTRKKEVLKKLDRLIAEYSYKGNNEYKVLDLYDNLSTCQRKSVKRVFRIIEDNFKEKEAKKIIETIADNFVQQ